MEDGRSRQGQSKTRKGKGFNLSNQTIESYNFISRLNKINKWIQICVKSQCEISISWVND